MAGENESIKRRVQLMASWELERELRRSNIGTGYRKMLSDELSSRQGQGGKGEETPELGLKEHDQEQEHEQEGEK